MIIFIVLLALVLRWYGINWDNGWHLHPDERMLIMVADRVRLFSQMNPDFFNYGSLPIYILKGIAQIIDMYSTIPMSTYDGMLGVGRAISTSLDLFTIVLIYKTSLLLFKNKKASLAASFLYAIAVFPIQNSHFFIVDTFLNFFMTSIIYLIISYLKKPHLYKVLLLALSVAAAITTKATGIVLLAPVGLTLLIPYKKQTKLHYFISMILRIALFGVFVLILAYCFMPYAFANNILLQNILRDPLSILNPKLVNDVSQQIQMNSDPFTFPYTLQYVGTTPYLYYIKNIALWGLGPFISLLSMIGVITFLTDIPWKKIKRHHFHIKKIWTHIYYFLLPTTNYQLLTAIYILFYLFYFLILGHSAVKFMRYMLPLYPPLTVMAGFAFSLTINSNKFIRRSLDVGGRLTTILLVCACIWTIMFETIYSREHTRIAASNWVYQNIAAGSTIAVEHWDDRLPLPIINKSYNFAELTLYDPDSPEKWTKIHAFLEASDYMIIASNRLYVPLMRLTDCKKLPPSRCYTQTTDYYKRLFGGDLGYEKVAEFSSYPTLQIGKFKLSFPDDAADESFTVYDHPKIMIFKKK